METEEKKEESNITGELTREWVVLGPPPPWGLEPCGVGWRKVMVMELGCVRKLRARSRCILTFIDKSNITSRASYCRHAR